jgi:hypothetical protein
MSKEELHKVVKDPAKMAEINAFLLTPEGRGVVAEIASSATEPVVEEPIEEPTVTPAVEEFNQEEADRQAAEAKALTEKAAASQIEEARKAEEDQALIDAGITIYRDASGNIVKLVQDYQADDGNGNPIGRPTHLEARSWVELVRKQKEAHTQATRAFHRLKDQKTTFTKKVVEPIKIPQVPLMSEDDRIQAALDLNSDDENVVLKAERKLRSDDILRGQQQKAVLDEQARQTQVSDAFKARHTRDYNPCQANAKLMTDYLREHTDAYGNPLAFTEDNLELAFAAIEPQLVPAQAPVETETAQPVTNTPAVPTTQQVTLKPPTPEIQPTAAAEATLVTPAAPPAAPNPRTVDTRRGVNVGLQPGQSTGLRPAATPSGLTMKDIAKWTGDQMKKERMNPARRAEIDRVIAAYNKSRASRV